MITGPKYQASAAEDNIVAVWETRAYLYTGLGVGYWPSNAQYVTTKPPRYFSQ